MTQEKCLQTCTLENEFLCRSLLYLPEARYGQPNCVLFHVDHATFPRGRYTFFNSSPIPLLDVGERGGKYLEAICGNQREAEEIKGSSFKIPPTVDYGARKTSNYPITNPINGDLSCDDYRFCYDVSLQCKDTKMIVFVQTNKLFRGQIYALGRSRTCEANVYNGIQFELEVYLRGQECNTQSS
ncbi:uncharacterized protein LOC143223897 [Tachypleus tridentatus]|uniref:uncharacterized protein LOC143223897 n=1 Tax=Tachypleus tridentatus TaxID=6853 RepID=UPI003FD0C79A